MYPFKAVTQSWPALCLQGLTPGLLLMFVEQGSSQDLENCEFHRRIHLEMFQGRVDPMACLVNENPSLFGIQAF